MYIFVYGTLMRGEKAHDYLAGARYAGTYSLRDHAIYNLGRYPGIRPKVGSAVLGEVYEIDLDMLKNMDIYEDEGSLYNRRTALVENESGTLNAYIYVYAKEINEQEIKGGRWNMKNSDRVWYACYGSNMLEARFRCYIDGEKRCFHDVEIQNTGCRDKTLWIDSRFLSRKGELYFAKESSKWGGGVAFFDHNGTGSVYMRLYNITWEQMLEVQKQEGLEWYGNLILLGCDTSGIPIYTVTAESRDRASAPSDAYYSVIKDALVKECGIDEHKAIKYLEAAME